MGQAGPKQTLVSIGGWLGGLPESESRAPAVAYAKLGELNIVSESGLSMTPVPGYDLSLGWMGGVRREEILVGVSKWAQEHDKLLALLTVYSAFFQTKLHHVGFKFESEAAMRKASSDQGTEALEVPAADHLRIYHKIENNLGNFYKEFQFFPDSPDGGAIHWDLITESPDLLLKFVAVAYGAKPIFWETGANDPIGVVWIKPANGSAPMGVMARSKDWKIEG